MTTVVLRPNEFVSSAAAQTPTEQFQQWSYTADDSDSTSAPIYAGNVVLGFTTVALPAGAVVKGYRQRIRWAAYSGSTSFWLTPSSLGTGFPAASFSDPGAGGGLHTDSASFVVLALTQAQLDGLRVEHAPVVGYTQIAERYFDITYVFAPVVDVLLPTGLLTTPTHAVTWTYTQSDADGGAQGSYQVKVFNQAQYSAGGFDPATATAQYDTGIVAGSATLWTNTYVEGTYRAYVRASDSASGGWSVWNDYAAFTVNLDAPEIASVIPYGDAVVGAVELTINRDLTTVAWDFVQYQWNASPNLIPSNLGQFEAASVAATGWTMSSVATPTATSESLQTTGAQSGKFLRVNATLSNGAARVASSPAIPIVGGVSYFLTATVKGTFAATVGVRLSLTYYDLSGLVISTDSELTLGITTSWRPLTYTRTAPLEAASVVVGVRAEGSTGAVSQVTVMDVDDVFLAEATAWSTLLQTDTTGADQTIVFDYSVPPGVAVRYRVRPGEVNPTYGNWFYVPTLAQWDSDDAWVKSPLTPLRNQNFCLAERPQLTRNRRQGIFDILGDPSPIVISDVLGLRRGTVVYETETIAEKQQLMTLLAQPLLLLQFPAAYNIEPMWVATGKITEEYESETNAISWEEISVEITEVTGP